MFKLTISLLTAFAVFAADGPGPLAPRGVRPPSTADIRVDVNMALVPVAVMDSNGRNVTGLGPENFRVFEGSRQVPIVSFGQQDQPITVGLIFDCSSSMRTKFRTAREAPRELFKQLSPDDRSFLITVSGKAELRRSLTSEFAELQNALVFTSPSGTTSLIDGIYMGLQQIRKSHNPRKALVVVSDGGDNNSRYTLHELESIAVETDTQIFAAGLFDAPQTQEEADGPALMNELCGRTGGVNFIIKSPSELRGVMARIGVTLHSQYVLGYYPPGDGPSGKFRKIKVQLLLPVNIPSLRIYARAGYYVPER